jgi:two-component system cell cycle sensor histidine kinase/response regulator CckA
VAHDIPASVAERPDMPTTGDSELAVVPRRRVLIVEDELSMRDFVDCVLRDAGYTTVRAVNGQEALTFAEHCGPFDLLLTDLVMPRMRGTELARRLRQTHPTLKVLYFTGYSDRLFQEKGALRDDETFLEKPSSIDGLVEAVSLLLDGQQPPATSPADVPPRH